MTQTIFADNTYSKPFFVTYINTSLFILPLFSILLSRLWRLWRANKLPQITSLPSLLNHLDATDPKAQEQRLLDHAGDEDDEEEGGGADSDESQSQRSQPVLKESARLGLRETAKLSFEFCMLWVGAY